MRRGNPRPSNNLLQMNATEQAILDHVNADNWALLYRCRWSKQAADRVVHELAGLLESETPQIKQEALRALFRIGTPAISAAPKVAILTQSVDPMTKHLAVLTLGQIAHTAPQLCVEPLASALNDRMCCRDALRVLAFIGSKANGALDRVKPLFSDADAKVRKAAVVTCAAINVSNPEVIEMLSHALADRSKVVRDAAGKCLQSARIG